jgi:hypothetical protein
MLLPVVFFSDSAVASRKLEKSITGIWKPPVSFAVSVARSRFVKVVEWTRRGIWPDSLILPELTTAR